MLFGFNAIRFESRRLVFFICFSSRLTPIEFPFLFSSDVLIRVRDTRVFHDFSKPFLLIDYQAREETFESLVKVRSFISLCSRFASFLLTNISSTLPPFQRGKSGHNEAYQDFNTFYNDIALVEGVKMRIDISSS
jgi:hypothetical protein